MIKNAEFITSVVGGDNLPNDNLPHILLLGRSNVGKSSLINALTNRKSLARVSATPGKTITLNLFLLDKSLYLVDAPGYGYARRSKTQTATFLKMITSFIEKNHNLKKIFLLIDFKVGPTVDDLEIYRNLLPLDIPLVIVATKYDKIPTTRRQKQRKVIESLYTQGQKIYYTSSEAKINIEHLSLEIENIYFKEETHNENE